MITKRVFIGIPIDFEPYVDLLANISYPSGLNKPRIVPRQNYHITLLFIGDIALQEMPELQKSLQIIANEFKKFSIGFKNISYAPPKGKQYMIWAQFEQNSSIKALAFALSRMILPGKSINIIPHITILRFKPLVNEKLPLIKSNLQLPDLHVKKFNLYESVLSPKGSIYKTIESYELK